MPSARPSWRAETELRSPIAKYLQALLTAAAQ
ncbi:MAG: hypothetical protein KatS3mg077_2011 [Candidatus Binatia bacterium]|nr:MAG: hypothetical protein KatS3mg077_2011 [Candidatus Binatia bacterium]